MAPTPFPFDGALPFVGRSDAMERVREWMVEAQAGNTQVGLIAGPPGIGKTRLVRELIDSEARNGWQTAWGRCTEASRGGTVVQAALDAQLKRAGIVHPSNPTDEPGSISELASLAAAYAGKAVELARRRPFIFVLDDLHVADAGTLNFFAEFVRSLDDSSHARRAALLVLVTHQEAWPGEPLDVVLQRVRRESVVRVLPLPALDEAELHELARLYLGSRCEPTFIEYLKQASNGNPFFVLEVLRELLETGQIVVEEGMAGFREAPVDALAPVSVTAPVIARLGRLDKATTRVVEMAAVIGDEIDPQLLGKVCGSPVVDQSLDAAVRGRLLTKRGDGYRFSHSIVRSATLDGMGQLNRQMAHRRIVTVLETHDSRDATGTLAIAYHLVRSGMPLDARHGAILERAADSAMNGYAWSTGAQYFEAALAITDYRDSLPADQLGVLLSRCARAHDNSGAAGRARARYFEAISAFREARDHEGWGYAILGWRRTFTNQGEPLPEGEELAAFLSDTGRRSPVVTARLLAQEAEGLWLARDERDLPEAVRAVAAAAATGDPEALTYAHATHGLALMRNLRADEALAAFKKAGEAAASHPSPRVRELGPARLASLLIMRGDLDAADLAASDSLKRARNHDDWAHASLELAFLHAVAMLRGDARTSGRYRSAASAMIHRSGFLQAEFILAAGVALERMMRAEFDGATDAIGSWGAVAGRSNSRTVALLCRARSGDTTFARTELEPIKGTGGHRRAPDFINLGAFCALVELADELNEPGLAEGLFAKLEPVAASGIAFSLAPPFLVPRIVAVAARLAGLDGRAGHWLETAEGAARASGAEVELGLVHLERARLLHAGDAPPAQVSQALRDALAVFIRLDLPWAVLKARAFAHESGFADEERGLLPSPGDLSAIEREILVEFARGLTAAQVADRLLLHERMVEDELLRIRKRTGISSRDEARLYLEFHEQPSRQEQGLLAAGLLTRRESEVLRLLASGKTNQQIADELVISPHTAIRHVANIMAKTYSATRTEAAAWARQQGLLK